MTVAQPAAPFVPAWRRGAEIHISDVSAYKTCRRAWNWSSMHRRNLTPRRFYAPFFTGSAIHYALDQFYKFGTDHGTALGDFYARYLAKVGEAAVAVDQELIGRELELASGVLEHYYQWAASDKSAFAERNLELVGTEQRFEAPIFGKGGKPSRRFYLAGRIDRIVRSKIDGALYLVEYKTTRSVLERAQNIVLEQQANAYLNAAGWLVGEPVAGIIYILIRKKIPTTPRPLKNGKLSVDQSIDTTAERYLAAVRAHHGAEATNDFIKTHYNDILAYLLSEPNKFFSRIAVRRTEADLRRSNDELQAAAVEMLNPKTAIYLNDGNHCRRCLFREPCIALQNGLDPEPMLASAYVQNDYHKDLDDDA